MTQLPCLVAEQNQGAYDQLALDLVDLVQALQKRLPQTKPRWMPYSIENAARAIGEQAAHIKERQDRSRLGQVTRASDNEMDILRCYRRIEHVFRQLQVGLSCLFRTQAYRHQIDISLSTWDLTHEQWVRKCSDVDAPGYSRQDSERNNEWTRNPDSPKVHWMNGMAGTGKTTITYSLCEQLEKSKHSAPVSFALVPRQTAATEISMQFEKLIAGPLSKVKDAIPEDVIVVIDALDECAYGPGAQLLFDLLFDHAAALPVRLFVSSRPEPGILHRVQSSERISRSILHLHEVEESFVRQTYIHTSNMSSEKLKLNLKISSSQKSISQPQETPFDNDRDNFWDFRKTYRGLMSYIRHSFQAFRNLKDDEDEALRWLLHVVIGARESLTVAALAELTSLESEDEVQLALAPSLGAQCPTDTRVVSTLHASFPDFMLSAERSKEFIAKGRNKHAFKYIPADDRLTELRAMYKTPQLRHHICSQPHIKQHPSHLSIRLAVASTESRVRQVRPAALTTWATGSSVNKLALSRDGKRMVSAGDGGTISVWIWILFLAGFRRLYHPYLEPIIGAQVGPELTGHLEAVMCVLFSSNGDRLFSCSDDRTIRIWDWRTGTVIGNPLKGHTDWVDCIALSPDICTSHQALATAQFAYGT
ncbi:WD40 repeat-like protein [Rhizoctonia solani]|uniref:WD40 repeat-like protein n=1 Tax=Rhizoctonia solani TaxID=456999 RepID=A0A8H7M4K1_9AGAM|nr:WD40 repeat-like protein [Rhizoctonia solani]